MPTIAPRTLLSGLPASALPGGLSPQGGRPLLLGINLAGADAAVAQPDSPVTNFAMPGVNASGTYNSIAYSYRFGYELQWLYDRGVRLIRLPLKWERLQKAYGTNNETTLPNAGLPLNPEFLTLLDTFLANCLRTGLKVVLSLHSATAIYSFNGATPNKASVGTAAVPTAAVLDLWQKVALRYKGHPAIWGYGLLNEPDANGMSASWPAIAQTLVTGIRTVDTATRLIVYTYSPFFAVTDPSNNVVYEVHRYPIPFQGDGFTPSFQGTSTAIAATGLQAFTITPTAGYSLGVVGTGFLQQSQLWWSFGGGSPEKLTLASFNSGTGVGTATFGFTHAASTAVMSGDGSYLNQSQRDGYTPTTFALNEIDFTRSFETWLRANNAKGYVGEFGIAHTRGCPDAEGAWLPVMDNYLSYLHANSDVFVAATAWGAGPSNIVHESFEPSYTYPAQGASLTTVGAFDQLGMKVFRQYATRRGREADYLNRSQTGATNQGGTAGYSAPITVTSVDALTGATGATAAYTLGLTLTGAQAATVYAGCVSYTANAPDGSTIDATNYPKGYPNDLGVYYQGVKIDCDVRQFQSSSIVVWFKLQASLAASTTDSTNYALRYGILSSVKNTLANVFLWADNFVGSTLNGSYAYTSAGMTPTVSNGTIQFAPINDTSKDPCSLNVVLPAGSGTNLDVQADMQVSLSEASWNRDTSRCGVGVRGDQTHNYYALLAHTSPGPIAFMETTVSWLSTFGSTLTSATWNGFRLSVIGGAGATPPAMQGKVWTSGSAEPSWTVATTTGADGFSGLVTAALFGLSTAATGTEQAILPTYRYWRVRMATTNPPSVSAGSFSAV